MRRREEKFPDNGFEAWGGYMQAKIAKLEEQFDVRAENDEVLSNIFSGVSIYVNGFTDPSADELKSLMSKHGGVYHTYQRSDDYIVASNLPDTKVKNMSLKKIVRPEWITDSIKSHCLLDYRQYLLYKTSRTQKQLNFDKILKKDFTDTVLEPEEINTPEENIPVEDKPETSDNSLHIPVDPLLSINEIKKSHNLEKDSKNIAQNGGIQHSTKTAADPNFISEFYNNSRLHHISQLGACFKQHINDLRDKSDFNFPARNQLKDTIQSISTANTNLSKIRFEKGKTIMHIDMDCFFVSVGLRNRPDLRGKPVAVTHSKRGKPRTKRPGVDRNTEFNLYRQRQGQKIGKAMGLTKEHIALNFESRVDNITDEDDKYGSMSEIASCSYEARAKGIGNGMFMGPALKLCPELQTIPYDFEGYKEVAYTLYNTIAQYTLDIEAVSCDEMYVDCSDILKDIDVNVEDFAIALRNEIKTKTGCPCSTGFGGNRLQARLATKRAKPDGQYFLSEDLVADFMYHIKLKDLPGVGRQISQKLESLGHTTCGSLQQMSLPSLKCHLGVKTGTQLFDQCRGRDNNPLTFQTVRKSVSAEVNYGIRFENNDQCLDFLKQLCSEVHSRMIQLKLMGKCITLKLMVRAEDAPVETAKFMGHGFCNVINKSTSLTNATNDVDLITKEVVAICKKLNIEPKEMRGVGIQITKLESLISKPITGALNKFLCPKSAKPEIKTDKALHIDKAPELQKLVEKTDIEKYDLSPRKPKILCSPKKSPIIQMKSPIKRRGRPPKSAKQSSSKNLLTKFLQGQNIHSPYRNPMIMDITHKNTDTKEVKPQTIEMPTKEVKDQPKGLLGLPWREVRELLRAWLESGQTPLPCDISLISMYMQEMVVNKNIEKLNILINFLKRSIHEMGNSEWIQVYTQIMEQVQNTMIAVYGKKLYISD